MSPGSPTPCGAAQPTCRAQIGSVKPDPCPKAQRGCPGALSDPSGPGLSPPAPLHRPAPGHQALGPSSHGDPDPRGHRTTRRYSRSHTCDPGTQRSFTASQGHGPAVQLRPPAPGLRSPSQTSRRTLPTLPQAHGAENKVKPRPRSPSPQRANPAPTQPHLRRPVLTCADRPRAESAGEGLRRVCGAGPAAPAPGHPREGVLRSVTRLPQRG